MIVPPTSHLPRTFILMGVCGCGKSLIGARLAARLGGVFEDSDHFHPPGNVEKMRAGIPLTDADRLPWYATLRARIVEMRGREGVYVLACSALKEMYRGWLRSTDSAEEIVFIHLKGTREVIHARMSLRKDHYMPVSLLDSQFAILEETPDLWAVPLEQTPEQIEMEILKLLAVPGHTET